MYIPFENNWQLYNLLRDDGGFSLNRKLESPTSGYMVSVTDRPHLMISPEIYGKDIRSIVHIVFRKLAWLLKEGEYVGGWVDTDGYVWMEISKNVETLEEAVWLALEHHQLAIYDITNKQDILITGD